MNREASIVSALLLVALVPIASARADWNLTTLASFNGTNGSRPAAGVTFDAAGNIYGTASDGGASNYGSVWEIDRGSNAITTLASFDGMFGKNPTSRIAFDAAGNMFGTAAGGPSNFGILWQIPRGSNTLTNVASFTKQGPAGVTFDTSGNLYVTTGITSTSNRGTVWEMANGSSTLTALATLDGAPVGGVTFDAAGNMYGTTYNGGGSFNGTVWELAKGSNTITTLAFFNGTNGSTPSAGVTLDASGNLYGTTSGGGLDGLGTIWEIAKGSNAITTLQTFDFDTRGYRPYGGVIFDTAGNMYGTNRDGGANGHGTIWEIAKGTNTLTVLFSFKSINGLGLQDLTLGPDGNLYGTTTSGGANGGGTVFMLSPNPVPEASSFALIALGGSALAFAAWRKRRIRS